MDPSHSPSTPTSPSAQLGHNERTPQQQRVPPGQQSPYLSVTHTDYVYIRRPRADLYEAQSDPTETFEASSAASITAQHLLERLRTDLEGTLQAVMPLLFRHPNEPVSLIFSQPGFAEQIEAGMLQLQRLSAPLQRPQPRQPRSRDPTGHQHIRRRLPLGSTPAAIGSRPSTTSSGTLSRSREQNRASNALPARGHTPDTQGTPSHGSLDSPDNNEDSENEAAIDQADDEHGEAHVPGDRSHRRKSKRPHDATAHTSHDGDEDDPVIISETQIRPGYKTSERIFVASLTGQPPTKVLKSNAKRFERPVLAPNKSTPIFGRAPRNETAGFVNGHSVHYDKHGILRRGKGTQEPLDCMPARMALLEAHGAFARIEEPTIERDDLVKYAVDEERARYPVKAQGDREKQIQKANNFWISRRKGAIDAFFSGKRAAPHTLPAGVDINAEEERFRKYTFEECIRKPLQWKPKGKLRNLLTAEQRTERDQAFDRQRDLSSSVRDGDATVRHERFPQLRVPAPVQEKVEISSDEEGEEDDGNGDSSAEFDDGNADEESLGQCSHSGGSAEAMRHSTEDGDGHHQHQSMSTPDVDVFQHPRHSDGAHQASGADHGISLLLASAEHLESEDSYGHQVNGGSARHKH